MTSSAQLRPISWSDESTLRELYDVLTASQRHERPHFTARPFDEAVPEWRAAGAEDRALLAGMWVDGELVGVTNSWLPLPGQGRTVMAHIDVHPDHRGRGYGARLLDALIAEARRRDMAYVLTQSTYPASTGADHPYRRFAQRNHLEVEQVSTIHRLALPVPADRLDRLEESARAARGEDYEIASYVDVPAALVPTLCDLVSLVEAPEGSGRNPRTPEDYLAQARHDALVGRSRATSIATERASSQAVAYTEFMVEQGGVWAHLWATFVHPDHRGHQLGMSVKVANLRRLAREHPECVAIVTSGVNDPGLARIDEKLGFEPFEVHATFSRRI